MTTTHLLEIHLIIINPSTPRFPERSLSLWFSNQDPTRHHLLPHTSRMHSPSRSSRFYHPHNIWWGVQQFSSSFCNLLHFPVTSSLLGPNILLNTIFSNTFSFLSSLAVSDQASKLSWRKCRKIIAFFKFAVSPWLNSYLGIFVDETGICYVKDYSLLVTCHVLGVISRYSVCDKGWAPMESGFFSRYGQKIFYFTLRPKKLWGLRRLLPKVHRKIFSR